VAVAVLPVMMVVVVVVVQLAELRAVVTCHSLLRRCEVR
jgi:hypothetical protein